MPQHRLTLCCFALAATSIGGCTGPLWVGGVSLTERSKPTAGLRRDAPLAAGPRAAVEFRSMEDPRQQPSAAEAAEQAESDLSLGTLLVGVERLRQQSPADYAALKQALADTQGALPQQYERMFQDQLMAVTLQRQAANLEPTGNLTPSAPAPLATSLATPAEPHPVQPALAPSATPVSSSVAVPERAAVAASPPPQAVAITASAPPATNSTEVAPASAASTASAALASSLEAAPTAAAPPPVPWRDALDETVQALERELLREGLDASEKARLEAYRRLLHVVGNEREAAVAAMEGLDEDEREFWKHQLYALLVALDADGKHAASRRAALALRELRQSEHHLANISTLDLKNLALCSEAISYGEFKEFESYAFRPNEQVVLYVEVENFAVHANNDRFETELHGSFEILDEAQRRVTSVVLAPDRQVSSNRRRDYFIGYLITLPAELKPGSYRLQLTIEDVIGKKSNQAAVDFRIR